LSYSASGQIGDNSSLTAPGLDVDLVAIQLAQGEQVTVDVDTTALGSSLDAVLRVFNAAGQQVALNDDFGNSTDPQLEFTTPIAGLYYIGVSSYANLNYNPLVAGSGFAGGTGAYDLNIVLTPDAASRANFVSDELDVPDVDAYAVDWTGLAGKTIDIVATGLNGADFSGELLELVAANGSTVLATAIPRASQGQADQLVISNFVVPADGAYSLRFTSLTQGDYTIVVVQGGAFESEPNDQLADPLRQLLPGQFAMGFLGPEGPASFATLSTGNLLFASSDSEPNNNTVFATPVPLGFDPGEDAAVDIDGSVSFSDVDYFKFVLEPGDVFGANIAGSPDLRLSLRDSQGVELIGSSSDLSSIYPDASPLPGGGDASLSRVIDAPGQYYLRVSGNAANYDLNLRVFRPGLESRPPGSHQKLFLDFDGAIIDRGIFGLDAGATALSPLSSFLGRWGLSPIDEDAVIDAVIAAVYENLSLDIRTRGPNGDFDVTGVNGDFDIEILNSRDHADPFGDPNVSRVIISGSTSELGLYTIGIAESIDVGNFDAEESAVVLLDILSGSSGSLNDYMLAESVSKADFIGLALGNIAVHEAAHIFGTFHTTRFNLSPIITDEGGNLSNHIGLVGNVWGDGDEIDVDFGVDQYSTKEGFTGYSNSISIIAYGLSTAIDPALVGPKVMSVSPPAGPLSSTIINDIVIEFNQPLDPLTAVDPLNYYLIAAGPNGVFDDAGGDDVTIPVTPSYDGDRTVQLAIDGGFAPLKADAYRLIVDSNVHDVDGNALNSKFGATNGFDYVHEFSMIAIGPGGDLYRIALGAGQKIELSITTPLDDAAAFPLNDLRTQLSLFDESGVPVAISAGSNGKNARLEFRAQTAGIYTVQVVGLLGSGEYVLHSEIEQPQLPEQLADFDQDDDSDGADFLAWQRHFGAESGAAKSDGDADGDQDVDGDDLVIWKALFGTDAYTQPAFNLATTSTAAQSLSSSELFEAPGVDALAAAVSTSKSRHIASRMAVATEFSGHDAVEGWRRGQSPQFAHELNERRARVVDRQQIIADSAFASMPESFRASWTFEFMDLTIDEQQQLESGHAAQSIAEFSLAGDVVDFIRCYKL
jgi:hypothetical protein